MIISGGLLALLNPTEHMTGAMSGMIVERALALTGMIVAPLRIETHTEGECHVDPAKLL